MSSQDKQVQKKKKRQCNFLYDFVKITGAVPILCWMRPKIIYASGKRPKVKGGVLIASNHVGLTDPILIHCAFWRRRLNCIATKDLYNTKTKEWFFNQMHCIMVDKQNFNMRTFHVVCERLSEEKAVVIFPEGGLNHTHSLMAFKSGAILMAYKAKKPVLPVYINETTKWTQRRVVVVGDPIYFNETSNNLPSMAEITRINNVLQEKEVELMEIYNNYKKQKEKK